MNVQGLITKRSNKLTSPELQNIFKTNDIVCLTETWGNNCHNFDVDGFEYFVLNRSEIKKGSKRSSGGVIIYIRNELVCTDTLLLKGEDSYVWVKLRGDLFHFDKNSRDFGCKLCWHQQD